MTTPPATEVSDASALRHQLVEQLRADNHIRTAAVERAFRTVPRHAFAPEVTLEAAYADDTVPTRHAPDGRVISSISAPWLQADMLEAARIQPGHHVLETLESRQVHSPAEQPRTRISAGRRPAS
ncbi:hypothetical protein ACFYO6_12855 [Streptomyces anthocyanicus]|uniref:hypothetical protein n=1 Tax=Streptomyces anthocyanicus TaxID=68174 RepID=UPI0036B7A4B4